MPQLTGNARIARIKQLQEELNRQPPQQHETIPVDGVEGLCDVITIDAHDLLLNHRSHRIRTQLEDAPEWEDLKGDPQGDEAQALIAQFIREEHETFAELRQSLKEKGQEYAGVITYDGVLINGNTRAVLLRDFPITKRGIRVAVLRPTVTPQTLTLIENRLQTQKDLKGPYSMTNFLLLVEDLHKNNKMSPEDVAAEMRISLGNPKKGASEVLMHLQILDLLRKLRKIPKTPLPLNWFNRVKTENMKGVLGEYRRLLEIDGAEAEGYLHSQLLAFAVGITSVHQIRKIETSLIEDYVGPQLEEDSDRPSVKYVLASPSVESEKASPRGVATLKGGAQTNTAPRVDLVRLINVATQAEKYVEVTVENKTLRIDKADVVESIHEAMLNGVKEKKLIERTEDKLAAPADHLKLATTELANCIDAIHAVQKDPQFGTARKDKVAYALKKVKQRLRDAEAVLAAAGIVPK